MIDSLPPITVLAARRPHGDRIRYMAGCRCLPCRAANSRYETPRAEQRRKGNSNPLVGTTAVRLHLVRLSRVGVGYRQVARVAKVNAGILFKIRAGDRDNIRAQSARRVLEVTAQHLAPAATVPARLTWKRLDWLLGQGFTKSALARKLGSTAKVPSLQVRRGRVLVRTARRVKRIYDFYNRNRG